MSSNENEHGLENESSHGQEGLNETHNNSLHSELDDDNYLEEAYMSTLGRSADAEGKAYWLNELQTGHVDRNWLLNAFSDSAEGQEHALQTTGGSTTLSNANYLEETYHSVLGRSPDDAGKSFWLNELETGHIDRASLRESFSESEEGHAHLALIGISPTTPDAALAA